MQKDIVFKTQVKVEKSSLMGSTDLTSLRSHADVEFYRSVTQIGKSFPGSDWRHWG